MKTRHFGLWVTLLLLISAAVLPVSAETTDQNRPSGCPVNDFQLLGQRWRAGNVYDAIPSFVDSGTRFRPASRPTMQDHTPGIDGILSDDAIRTAISTYVGFDINRLLTATPVPTLIIVVDDFSTPTPETSHGAAVYAVTERLITGLGIPSSRVRLVSVDTAEGNYNLATVANQIDAVIRANPTYRRYVINLSFIIIPCQGTFNVGGVAVSFNFDQFITQYDRSDGEVTLYAQAAAVAPSVLPADLVPPPGDALGVQKPLRQEGTISEDTTEIPPEFARGIAAFAQSYHAQAYNPRNTTQTNDPIRLLLRRARRLGVETVVIASAGNFGQPEAFAPGSFPEVISVSASIGLDFNTFWLPSNAGEVMAPGAWFPLEDEFVAGTSFSAPAMSVMTALVLSTGASCNFTSVMDGQFNNTFFARAALSACRLS